MNYVASMLNVNVYDSWMVGDSINDVQAAVNTGIPGIAVTYGYNQGIDFRKAGASRIIDRFSDISEIIRELK